MMGSMGSLGGMGKARSGRSKGKNKDEDKDKNKDTGSMSHMAKGKSKSKGGCARKILTRPVPIHARLNHGPQFSALVQRLRRWRIRKRPRRKLQLIGRHALSRDALRSGD